MFTAISATPGTAERCAEAIRERILSGDLVPGDRLPAERELAETLGVNRLTLRAALTELRAAGLVRVKHGSGYTVESFTHTSGPALLPALVRSSTDAEARAALCADLLLLRRHLAAAALTKLAARPSETSLVAAAVDHFTKLANTGASPDALAAADVAIVAAILESTGSIAFRLILNPLTRALDEVPELRAAMYRQPLDNARAYTGLLAWLENPNAPGIGVLIELLEARDRQTLNQLGPVRRRPGKK